MKFSHSDSANFHFYTQPGHRKFSSGQNPAGNFRLRLSLSFAFLFCVLCTVLSAQGLEVPVKLEVDKGNLDNIQVKVTKNGKEVLSQKGSKNMKLKLDFNQKYILTFSKSGYITKTIEFSTNAPEARIKQGFDPYKIGIKLFQQNEENMVVYNQPVGKIKYDQTLDDFNFETDYSKSILSAMNEVSGPAEKEETKENIKTEIIQEKPVVKSASGSSSVGATVRPPSNKPEQQGNEVKFSASISTPVPHDTARNATVVTNVRAEEKTKPVNPQQEEKSITAPQPAQGNDQGYFKAPASYKEYLPGTKPVSVSDSPQIIQHQESGEDAPPVNEVYREEEKITREDIVEKNRVIVRIKVIAGKKNTEYSFVNYQWGGRYFFRNNVSITETLFTQWTGFAPDSDQLPVSQTAE